jgi:hypothetical protein
VDDCVLDLCQFFLHLLDEVAVEPAHHFQQQAPHRQLHVRSKPVHALGNSVQKERLRVCALCLSALYERFEELEGHGRELLMRQHLGSLRKDGLGLLADLGRVDFR